MSRLKRSLEITFLLGLTDRYPEFRRGAVEQIYEAFKGEGKLAGMLGGSSLTNLPACFAAVAIDDPERAVQRHKKFANALTRKREATSRYRGSSYRTHCRWTEENCHDTSPMKPCINGYPVSKIDSDKKGVRDSFGFRIRFHQTLVKNFSLTVDTGNSQL